MLTFKRLTLQNFLSIGADPQTVSFDASDLTLVLGDNQDAVGGEMRNGAGKTTVLQGLSFALFGKPLTKIKNGNLVNNVNEKNANVSLTFDRDGREYRIERGLKPTYLRFFVEDDELGAQDEAQGENRRTQEEVDRVLDGMSYLLFKHIIALNTYADPILKMAAAEQRALIEELFGATQMSRRAEALKKQIVAAKADLRDEETRLAVTQQANARIEGAIVKARGELALWDRLQAKRIAQLQQDLESVSGVDFEAELALIDAAEAFAGKAMGLRNALALQHRERESLVRSLGLRQQALRKLKSEQAALDPEAQVAKLDAEIRRKTSEMQRYQRDAADTGKEADEVRAQLASPQAGACERCGQELTSPEHLAAATRKLDARLRTLMSKAEQDATRAAEMQASVFLIDTEKSAIEHLAAKRFDELEAQILAADAELTTETLAMADVMKGLGEIQVDLDALGEPPMPTFEARDQVYELRQMHAAVSAELERLEAEANPHLRQIAQLEDTLQAIDLTAVEALRDLVKHQEVLVKLLTHRDSFIRRRIIEDNLPYLNSCVNGYLTTLGLPHAVDFQPDLTVEITKLGKEFDFEQLSRGEANRVIMATSWAFRDVWENLNTSVNLMCVDEMIDSGMCDAGAEAALGVLKTMAHGRGKNVFLISHKDNLRSRVGAILVVRKVDDFTKFTVEAV